MPTDEYLNKCNVEFTIDPDVFTLRDFDRFLSTVCKVWPEISFDYSMRWDTDTIDVFNIPRSKVKPLLDEIETAEWHYKPLATLIENDGETGNGNPGEVEA